MNFFNIFSKLSQKHVILSDLGVPYRVFVNWSDKQIIDYKVSSSNNDKNVTRKRVSLNYFEALWVLIVKELRLFGVPLKVIREVKVFLFSQIDISTISKDNNEIKAIFKEAVSEEVFDLMEESGFNEHKLEDIVSSDFNGYEMYTTNLGGLVSSVLLLGHSPSLIFYRNPIEEELNLGFTIFNPIANKIEAALQGRDFRDDLVHNLINFSVFSIPILPLITMFYQDESLFKYTNNFALYTPNELELLEIIKGRNFKQIKIYKSQQGDKLNVEIINEKNLKNNDARELKKILGLKQYERAEVIFRNDKHLLIKNMIKKEL